MNELIGHVFEIPVIGEILNSLFTINPVLGGVLVFILTLLMVNKICITTLNYNFLKQCFEFIRGGRKEQRYDKERKLFHTTASTKDFTDWQNKILEKIYEDVELVHLFGQNHMTVTHKSALNLQYPFQKNFKEITTLHKSKVQDSILDKFQKRYYRIMSANIKKPKLIGFELEEYQLNNNDEILGFTANICQYQQTVTTSHILEYELYCAYKKNKTLVNKTKDEILSALKYRKKIHQGQSNKEVILQGANRHSLLSVQMMMVCFDEKSDTYKVLIFKRSDKVALKPNYWHIIPAGGFEIFEKEDTVNEYIIEQNFDVELALFRELIEEVFNGKDFESNETGEANNIIHKHPDIMYIEELLKNKEAHLEFLGNVTDLMTLRQELSFLLIIDNPDFLKRKFKINFEGMDLQLLNVNELSRMFKAELLYPSSAGLLNLAKETKLMKDRNLLQDQQPMQSAAE